MSDSLSEMLECVHFTGADELKRDEHGLPVVIEDDPDDPAYGRPWSDPVPVSPTRRRL